MERCCDCKEGKFIKNGLETVIGLNVHDCQYITQRNALIPEAMKLASSIYLITDSVTESSWWGGKPVKINLWSREFLAQMDKLVWKGIYKKGVNQWNRKP